VDELVDAAIRVITVAKGLPNSKVENLAPQQSAIVIHYQSSAPGIDRRMIRRL